MKFKTDLVRQRLLDLHLTYRDAARHCGLMGGLAMEALNGGDLDGLTWREITAICNLLGVSARDLMDWPDDPHPNNDLSAPNQPEPNELARRLGSVLLSAGRPLPIQSAAHLLGVEPDELDEPIDTLATQLAGSGIVLHNRAGNLLLAPAANAPWKSDIAQALAVAIDVTGLSVTEADFLGRVFRGPTTTAKRLAATTAKKPALHRLYNAGLIERPESETEPLRLTDAAERSLRRFASPAN